MTPEEKKKFARKVKATVKRLNVLRDEAKQRGLKVIYWRGKHTLLVSVEERVVY